VSLNRSLALLTIASLLPRAAFAQSNDLKVRCASAYEQAQRTRKEGLLRASREHLLVCAEEACPAVLRNDCVKWLGEVDAAMPTVLLVARDDSGNDVVDVSVSIDGTKILDRLDGKAVAVDPGAHTFRFVRDGRAVEQQVLVREGDKRRSVAVTFESEKSTPRDHAPPASATPTGAIVLATLGVVAIGAGVGLYVVGAGQKKDLDACSPRCDPDQVSHTKRTFVYGDVAMGLGIVALASGVIVWVASPSKDVSAGVAPTNGGVAATFMTRF
jgi:hypothetical protein